MASPAQNGGPLRLLWVIDSLTMGGAESLVPVFARAIDPRRIALSVCCLKRIGGNPVEARLLAQGVDVVHLDARHLRDLSAFRRLVRLIRTKRVQLVHAHLTDSSIWGTAAASIAGVPHLVTVHVAPAATRRWSRQALRDSLACRVRRLWGTRVIVVSQALAGAIRELPPRHVSPPTVVHNGVDIELFGARSEGRRLATRIALNVPFDTTLVTTVSVLRDGKGIDVLLSALVRLSTRVANHVVCCVVGDGPLRPRLEAQAVALGVADRVRWTGVRNDVPDILAASDVFVLPTLADAFPTALLEAMASGLPCVASRVGGVPEILTGDSGVMVEPGDLLALAQAIASLLDDPERAARLGERARARVTDVFSSAAWVARLEHVYADVLGGSAGALTT